MGVERAREVLDIEIRGIEAVRDKLDQRFEDAVRLILDCPSRLIITGIGKSGIIGQKIAATLNSTGTPAFFLHPVEALHGDLGMVGASDVVLAISYSGETSELNRLMATLRRRAAAVIAMTSAPDSTLARHADVILDIGVPREACPLGLAPTSSTTATLALGDALAVVLLERKQFRAEDFRRNHPAGSLGERLKVAVREVMLTGEQVPVVALGTPLSEAVSRLDEKNVGAVVVVDGRRRVRGIVTDGDVRRLILAHGGLQGLSLEQAMTPHPVIISPATLAADALSVMQDREITVLPVVGPDGSLEGILHLHDLLGKGEFRFLI